MIGAADGDDFDEGKGTAVAREFEETLKFLYTGLSSNATVVRQLRSNQIRNETSLAEMTELIEAMGWTIGELEGRFNFIHVAGTKGKGSVCAFTESILRHCSIRTGMFTSPHLISPCERIRIDGRSIELEVFCRLVRETADRLRAGGVALPGFFRFMLLVALAAFREARVEAAILEVGIGGRFDATNILTRPIATAITELGMDHTDLLGDSLASIAWHKAGIIKAGAAVFSVKQREEAGEVVERIARELCAPLTVVSEGFPGPVGIGGGHHQRRNAAMAVEIAQHWIRQQRGGGGGGVDTLIDPKTLQTALLQTHWPGRHQIVEQASSSLKWYIDGAHTVESMELTARWFMEHHRSDDGQQSILFFHCSEDRSYQRLLERLSAVHFDEIILAPPPPPSSLSTLVPLDRHYLMAEYLALARAKDNPPPTIHVATFEQAMEVILPNLRLAPSAADILVTGSLYVVGAVLEALKVKV